MHRTEFNAYRTDCDCEDCTLPCKHKSGFLIPSDLKRISDALNSASSNIAEFANEHLEASPGAVVLHQGHLKSIPTLVPRRRADGSCHWLTEDNKCSIHEVAPFGCAFFDSHMDLEEGKKLSAKGLVQIAQSYRQPMTLYAMIWSVLSQLGKTTYGPEEAHKRMEAK